MKSLVVFYSRTGTCRAVAEKVSKSLNCDLEEVFDEKSRAGPLGWLGSGKDGSKKSLTKIKPCKFDASKFDTIVFGSPIWARNVAPAIRTYIFDNKHKLGKIAFFCTMGGNNPAQFFRDAESICQKKLSATLAVNVREASGPQVEEKIKEFVKKLG